MGPLSKAKKLTENLKIQQGVNGWLTKKACDPKCKLWNLTNTVPHLVQCGIKSCQFPWTPGRTFKRPKITNNGIWDWNGENHRRNIWLSWMQDSHRDHIKLLHVLVVVDIIVIIATTIIIIVIIIIIIIMIIIIIIIIKYTNKHAPKRVDNKPLQTLHLVMTDLPRQTSPAPAPLRSSPGRPGSTWMRPGG